MNKPKTSLKDLAAKWTAELRRLQRYTIIVFLIFVAALYGFLLLRINSLTNEQPSQDAVTSDVKAANVPHIDQSVVQQIQSLQDNSVSVQSLFDNARNNPFQ